MSQIIISELLTCASHNLLMTGRTADDVAPSFSQFYSLAEIEHARDRLESIGLTVPKVSLRKNEVAAKQALVLNILKAIQENDWKGSNVKFVAANLTRICIVPDNINDEIMLRSEVASLHKKYDDIEKMMHDVLKTITQVNDKMTSTNDDLKGTAASVLARVNIVSTSVQESANSLKQSTESALSQQNDSYANVAKLKNPRTPSGSRKRIPNTSQLSPSDRRLHPGYQSQKEENSKTSDWKIVTSRRKPQAPIIGKVKSSIEAVTPIKISSIFVSRCSPNTSNDDLKEYLESQNKWTIQSVLKLKTRHETYSSFRVDLLRDSAKSEASYLNPDMWPESILVKRFNRERKFGSFAHDSAKTKHQ